MTNPNDINFRLISQNVRGLNDNLKREVIFNRMREKGEVIFLQETFSTPEKGNQWRLSWDGSVYLSHGMHNNREVMILISKNLEHEVVKVKTDNEGRFIIMKCRIQGVNLILFNVYAPNIATEHSQFLSKIKTELLHMVDDDCSFVIGGGDWNFIMDNNTDRSGGNLRVWHESVKEFTQISELFDLVDIWRTRNPFSCRYTWRRNRPSLVQSRIDRIYISDNLQYKCEKAFIIPGICSDHSAPCVTFKRLNDESKGRNYWKMNNSLLEDNEFVGLMSNKITEFVQMSQQLTSERSKWEYIKDKIREWVQQQSKIKARERQEAVKQLEVEIKSLEQQLNSTPRDAGEVYIRLERARSDLNKHYEYITRGIIIQSRVQYYEEGEKNTKYFLNLINRNKNKTSIRRLNTQTGTVTSQAAIMKTDKLFYEKLYTNVDGDTNNSWTDEIKDSTEIPQISENDKLNMRKPISKDELLPL